MSPKIEVKSVKHVFSPSEVAELNSEFRGAYEALKVVNSEFDSVKSQYKARIMEKEARMETLNATLSAGFEMRNKRCRVSYDVPKRLKIYHLEDDLEDAPPTLTVEMTADDFQQELFTAESKFEVKTEIELFPPAGNDKGVLVVGRFNDRWFSAIRASVGAHKLDERLDSEQLAAKERWPAIEVASGRYQEWLEKVLGKEAAKGFSEPLVKALAGQKERVE